VRQRAAALLMAGMLIAEGGAVGSAMTYVSADFPTLVRQAHAIAIGRVTSVQPRWREGRRGIETALTFDVEQYLKGDLGETVTLTVPGGQMGRYRTVMPGAPVFAEDEELVLFLAAGTPSSAHVLGLGQGVFRIMTDQENGARLVVPEILTTAQAGAIRLVRGDVSRRPMLLEQFASAVRAALVQEAGR
jgi:hypothetical protein